MGIAFAAAALVAGCGGTSHAQRRAPAPPAALRSTFGDSYAGTDYEQPSGSVTGCDYYTWLEPSCYTNTSLTSYHASPQQQLAREMNWITANRMGTFQRVFISLDELFSCFDATTGFCGYNSQALANLDDALSIIAASHQKVDLVLLAQDNAAGFHFASLDGYHPQMEQNYVTAVKQFVEHVAANATDSSVISVMDLQNEAFHQVASHLRAMTNVCGANPYCIDAKITHPWLVKLYTAAHAAAPQFNYTVSSDGDILDPRSDDHTWYAGIADVYDIHLYDRAPWSSQTRASLAAAKNLAKPWFVGEAGCIRNGSTLCSYAGNVNCTTPTACALSVDTWWLAHLHCYGASAVLVQNAATSFFSLPSLSLRASLVGRKVIQANAAH